MDQATENDEVEKVQRAQAGDPEAFDDLVIRWHNTALGTARALLESSEEARDAVQEAFLLAWQHRARLADPGRFGGWLRRIVVNVCHRRRRAALRAASLEAAPILSLSAPLRQIEDRLILDNALGCLSDPVQETVRLYYDYDWSVEEIASHLVVPVTTIKSRLRNARTRLRKELESSMNPSSAETAARRKRRLSSPGEIHHVAIGPDGRTLATVAALEVTETTFLAQVQLWDIATGDSLWLFSLQSWFRDLLFTPDGRQIVLSTGVPGRRDALDGTILFLDTASGEVAQERPTHPGALRLALSPDGKTLAAGFSEPGDDIRTDRRWGKIQLIDVATGTVIRRIEPHLSAIHALAFSPDGALLASTAGLVEANPEINAVWASADARLWEVASGALRHRLPRPNARGYVHNLAFSPDGALLATPNGWEGETLLYATDTGTLVRTLPGQGFPTFAVAFAPDGRTLATGDKEGQVRLWETATGSLQRTVRHPAETVKAMAFAPDSRTLITAGGGTVQVWTL